MRRHRLFYRLLLIAGATLVASAIVVLTGRLTARLDLGNFSGSPDGVLQETGDSIGGPAAQAVVYRPGLAFRFITSLRNTGHNKVTVTGVDLAGRSRHLLVVDRAGYVARPERVDWGDPRRERAFGSIDLARGEMIAVVLHLRLARAAFAPTSDRRFDGFVVHYRVRGLNRSSTIRFHEPLVVQPPARPL